MKKFSKKYDQDSILEFMGSEIRRLRKAAGWTQEQLAEQATINDKEVSHIEAGRRNITIETLVKLANALNIPPYEIIRSEPGLRGSPTVDD